MDHEIQPVKINDLNKTQLILLAILLSFVVSIATGIVTVTLMQQASPAVNQTINRVVQQTIEKVVPDYTPGKTQTVIVKEDDLVVDAITKTREAIFGIFATKDATNSTADAYSVGGGQFIVSLSTIDKTQPYIVRVGTVLYDATVKNASAFGFGLINVSKPDDTIKKIPSISFGKDNMVKAGQTLVIVGSTSITKGTVEAVVTKEQKDDAGKVTASWNIIVSNTPLSSDMVGELAVNLDGDAVGIIVSKGDSGAQILGIDSVTKFISDSAKVSGSVPPPAPPVATQ
jgi:hypothetical protein